MEEDEVQKSFVALMPNGKYRYFKNLKEVDDAIYEFLGWDFYQAYLHFTN